MYFGEKICTSGQFGRKKALLSDKMIRRLKLSENVISIKERKEELIMSKNIKKTLIGCAAVSIALVAAIIAVSFNAVKSNAKQISGEGSESTYTDQDGTVYVTAFLKNMAENSITVDVIEFVTSDNAERVNSVL